jgi:hypothetical protein
VPAPAPHAAPAAQRRAKAVPTPATSLAVLMRRGQLASVGGALSRSTFACADEPRPRAGLTSTTLASLLGRSVSRGVTIRTFDAGAPPELAVAAAGLGITSRTAPRAHVAYLPRAGTRPPSLVVVREAGADPEVRVVERR